MYKVEQILEFKKKRNRKLITPCCNKSNRDGKFINYKNLIEIYGYCHSCGETTLPPTIYKDEKGDEFIWNDDEKRFKPIVLQTYYKNVSQLYDKSVIQCNTSSKSVTNETKYIPESLVYRFLNNKQENNLLKYIAKAYGKEKMLLVKNMYYIGTSKDRGTVFWQININSKVQKVKVSYFNKNGRRTEYFKAPYLNENGYHSCLFGEHLLKNNDKPVVLVESEKTAMVALIELPNYTWLSYGGANGLTDQKSQVLVGRKVFIVPDMSEKAVAIIKKKIPYLKEIGVDAEIWDMTDGMTDEELKQAGWYNCDLEDVFRQFNSK